MCDKNAIIFHVNLIYDVGYNIEKKKNLAQNLVSAIKKRCRSLKMKYIFSIFPSAVLYYVAKYIHGE